MYAYLSHMIESSLPIMYVAIAYWKRKEEDYYKVATILFGNPNVTIVSGPKKKKKHRKTKWEVNKVY